MAQGSRGPACRTVENGTGVSRSVSAEARNLCSLAIVKPCRYRPSNNSYSNQHPIVIDNANRKLMANHWSAVPVQSRHESVC